MTLCSQIRTVTVISTALLTFAVNAASLVPEQIFAIGDSLSDTGNAYIALGGATTEPPYTELIPSAPYASRRLSNGPVWIEQLAGTLGTSVQASLAGGSGYAFGGARTGPLTGVTPSGIPTLLDQANQLTGILGVLPADALYVVWGGGNDVRDAVETGSEAAAEQIIGDALGNIASTVSTLAAAGAQNFLVPNLPDLSLTPAVTIAADQAGPILGPQILGAFHLASMSFNDELADTVLPGLESSFGIDIVTMDIEGLINSAVANPAEFGLTNATDTCIILGNGSCPNPDEYLFWDGLHPTTAAHGIITDLAYEQLAAVPLPAALPLFAAGLVLVGFTARRRPQPGTGNSFNPPM